jgi:hypothetical protein
MNPVYIPIVFLEDTFEYYPPMYVQTNLVVSFLQIFLLTVYMHVFSLPCVLHVLLISLDFVV